MKLLDKKFEKILSYSGKAVLLFTLLVVLFGPFGQILSTPVARAETDSFGNSCPAAQFAKKDASGKIIGCSNSSLDGAPTTAPATASAQTPGSASDCRLGPTGTFVGNCAADSSGNVKVTNSDGSTQEIKKTTATEASTQDALACSLTNPSVCLANVVYVFTVGLGSGLAYVGGFMFDTTVSLSLNSAAYALSFLSSGWTTARDLANMAFILILVYIAFTIMFMAETARTIQMLAWVIFIALIINFSFFFTRVVIDVGNILAVQFYNSIQAPTMQSSISTVNSDTGMLANTVTGIASKLPLDSSLANTKDLTASIMQALNIQQLFSNPSFQSFSAQSGFGTKLIMLSFLYITIGACYFILAAMFLAVGVKFLMRIVVLWFLIIASPLAFICKAVPNRPEISGWYDKWQHELVNHAFYPAFFLFIFFFISTVLSGLTASGGILGGLATDLNSLAATASGTPVLIMSMVANIAIRLGFVIAMLYIALKASEYMSVKGGELAHSVTGLVTRAGTGAVFGGAGLAGRYTMGLAGKRIAERPGLLGANARGGFKGVLAGGLLRTGEGLSKRSFDLRGAPGVRKGLGLVGIDTNEAGGKGGYATAYANRVKKMTERAERFKQNKGAYERELKKILQALPDDDKQNLAQAAKEVKDAQQEVDDFGSGDGRGNTLKAKTKQLKDLMKPYKEDAEKLAGKDFKDDYAKSLTTKGWHNLGGLTSSGIPGFISRADHEAASKLRDSKKEGAKLADLIGITPERAEDHPGEHWDFTAKRWVPDAPPAAPAAPTPPPAPAGGGGPGAAGVAAGLLVGGAAAAHGGPAAGGPTTPGTPPTPPTGGRGSGTIIPSSDIAPNPLTDAERAARFGTTPPPGSPGPLPFTLHPSGPTSPISGGPGTPPPSGGLTGEVYSAQAAAEKDAREYADARAQFKKRSDGIFKEALKKLQTKYSQATTPEERRRLKDEYDIQAAALDKESKAAEEKLTRAFEEKNASSRSNSTRQRDINGLGELQPDIEVTPNPVVPYVPPSRPQAPPSTPPMAPTPSTGGSGTGFTRPQQYTDKTGEVIDMHEQRDGSFAATPAASGELIKQMEGLRADVNNLKGAVTKSTSQSFVKPPNQVAPWTPKPAEASFSSEQKRQIKGVVTRAIEDKTEKLEEKLTAIEHLSREDIKTREKSLEKEARRILGGLDSIGPSDYTSTSENPPPAPRQKPEDAKPE